MENEGKKGVLLVGSQLDKLEKYRGTIVVRRMFVDRIDSNYATQFVKVHWGIPGNQFRIQIRNHGVFLIIFNRQEYYDKVKKAGDTWMGGIYTLVRGWKEGKGLGKESIESLPIWVSLPKFPKHLWDTSTFSSIGSMLGIPIRVDARTAKGPNDDGARLLVKMEASEDFPCEVPIFVQEDDGLVIEEIVHVHYVHPPPKCIRCKIFGHWTSQCISLQRLAGVDTLNSKNELEKKGEQEVKESYPPTHNKNQNKEKRPNKEKIGKNSGQVGRNKEIGAMDSDGIGMVGKDKAGDLSDLGFVGEGLGGKGLGDNLRGKKATMVGDNIDKATQTNPPNPRVTTKEWITKGIHTSSMDVDPQSPTHLGDPIKDPSSEIGGSDCNS